MSETMKCRESTQITMTDKRKDFQTDETAKSYGHRYPEVVRHTRLHWDLPMDRGTIFETN